MKQLMTLGEKYDIMDKAAREVTTKYHGKGIFLAKSILLDFFLNRKKTTKFHYFDPSKVPKDAMDKMIDLDIPEIARPAIHEIRMMFKRKKNKSLKEPVPVYYPSKRNIEAVEAPFDDNSIDQVQQFTYYFPRNNIDAVVAEHVPFANPQTLREMTPSSFNDTPMNYYNRLSSKNLKRDSESDSPMNSRRGSSFFHKNDKPTIIPEKKRSVFFKKMLN
eukprot:CAMPEP_0114579040 /NCGR_PEP_ID=MMETSP0125-20121206/3495_1 /TAXON_ID=485358 ORGANISM="Aristerostoma sp., Strain ATCC 50986" /NCGR_SAMPLE_ID=MMETSP0125 /ASSEMBLY_ACC=CAM_ASM_000245 /LENGTH=217 /DNA_ID=CAMNT_0001769543 /DNA_START=2295 /DNA_END=2948 /DNA_ORIENTATION=-